MARTVSGCRPIICRSANRRGDADAKTRGAVIGYPVA
jgi:hypothetical protein